MSAGGRAWRVLLRLVQRRRFWLDKGQIPNINCQQRLAANKIPVSVLQSAGPWAVHFGSNDVDS
eukprot:1389279-Prorocentrum_lima.AAC.1